MKKRLPLDPFDSKTPLSKDYQLGNLAWAVLLMGMVGGAMLVFSSDFDGAGALLKAAAGLAIIGGAAYIARRIIKSI